MSISSNLEGIAAQTHFVILSSIDLGSRMKVGKVTLLKSAPGRSCEMMCERTGERPGPSAELFHAFCTRILLPVIFNAPLP